ncbi:MAG: alkaline shock response membrane anchor protein AmaP [Chloroflexi bacterium]|nr:alkaline shock response membrane anchor protein AmaP [Chloroflexota bacterium]
MNLVNRLLIIVELLLALALMPIIIVVAVFFRAGIADAVNAFVLGLVAGPNAALIQATCVGVSAFVFVVAAILLFLELQRPSTHHLRVQSVTEGRVDVTADAITHRLEHAILQIADIAKVKARVVSASKGTVLDLFVELETSPEVNVPKKTQEVIAAAKQVLEEQMGLQVGKVQVQVHHTQPKK